MQNTLAMNMPKSRFLARIFSGMDEEKKQHQQAFGIKRREGGHQTNAPARSADHGNIIENAKRGKKHLQQAADNSAQQIKCQKVPPTQGVFHRPSKEINGQRIEKDVRNAGVHELKRQQLPDESALQPAKTQGKIPVFNFRAARRNVCHQLDKNTTALIISNAMVNDTCGR